MLILSRKVNEGVIILDTIEVLVTRIDRDTVKLGIRAPAHVGIYRKEIYNFIKDSNTLSAQNRPEAATLNALASSLSNSLPATEPLIQFSKNKKQ